MWWNTLFVILAIYGSGGLGVSGQLNGGLSISGQLNGGLGVGSQVNGKAGAKLPASINPETIAKPSGVNNPELTQETLLVTLNGLPGTDVSKDPQGYTKVKIPIDDLIELFKRLNIPCPQDLLNKKGTSTTATFYLKQLLNYLKSQKNGGSTPSPAKEVTTASPKVTKSPSTVSKTKLQKELELIPGATLVPNAKGEDSLNTNFEGFVMLLGKLGIPTKGVPHVSGINSYQIPVPLLIEFLNSHNILSPGMITQFLEKFANPNDSTPKPTPKPTENSILTYIKSLPGVTTRTNEKGQQFVRIPNESLIEAYKKYNIPIPKYMFDLKNRREYTYLDSYLITYIERYTDTGNKQNPNEISESALGKNIGTIPGGEITYGAKDQKFVNITLPALIELFKTLGISVSNLPSDLGDGDYSIPFNELLRLCNHNTKFDFSKLSSYLKQYNLSGSDSGSVGSGESETGSNEKNLNKKTLHLVLKNLPGVKINGDGKVTLPVSAFINLLKKLGFPLPNVSLNTDSSISVPFGDLLSFLRSKGALSPSAIASFSIKFGAGAGGSLSGGAGGTGEPDDDGCGAIAGAANGARNAGNGLLDAANGVVTGGLNYVPFVGGLGKKVEDLKTNILKGGLDTVGGKLLGGDKCKNKK